MWSSQIKGRIELLKTAFLGGEGAGKINEKKMNRLNNIDQWHALLKGQT